MRPKESYQAAAHERWHPTIPKATHSGILKIGNYELACDVLQDGRRVLRQRTFLKALGRGKVSGDQGRREDATNLPAFLQANNLSPYLEGTLGQATSPIKYKGPNNQKLIGYEASVLPLACKVYVQAEQDNVLQKVQLPIAQVCKTMLYALATVGITALVDEVTGYQEVRDRTELQKILDNYISEELREWTRKFPNEFFRQVYRIHGWDYPKIGNHPQYIGKFINKYIYEKLPEGVIEELKTKNPKNENGARKYCHHQFLTEDVGDDNLKKQIVQVITLMKVSNNVNEFKNFIERI